MKLNHDELTDMIKPVNLLSINREIKIKHVNDMEISIIKSGILRLPVIGMLRYDNDRLAVIDGQHLLSAFLRLDDSENGLDVIVKEYKDRKSVITDISRLNSTQKVWVDADYLKAWLNFGNKNSNYHKNYVYLDNQLKKTDLSLGILITAYSDTNNKNKFKSGELEFADKEFIDSVINTCTLLKRKYNKSSYVLRGVVKWCRSKGLGKNKEIIDFDKLNTRLIHAADNKNDSHIKDRDSYAKFIKDRYTAI